MKQYLLAGLLLLGGSLWAAAEAPGAGTRAIWIDVPFVQQTTDGCGSASLSMVMRYWDRKEGRAIAADAEETHIQPALFSPAAKGIFASSMRDYLERSGYQAFAFHGQWSDFEHQLALGRPMIVGLQASGALGPLHYVVVVGVDPARNFLFMNDPAQQKMLRISREGFEQEWRGTDNWTLLAVPKAFPSPTQPAH
jgi:ABC-type bacteriocin/lantibiotic exporter with double-glycine peptidase domain